MAVSGIEDRVVAAMKDLGFTATDAKAYVALLKDSPATGYELADAATRLFVERSGLRTLVGAWQASTGDLRIKVKSAGAITGGDPSDDPVCADEEASFQMSLRRDDQPAGQGMPALATRPGNYLMVTPKGEPAPAAALVYLGPNPDGTWALALVRPEADAKAGASVQRIDLEPGETWSRPVVSEDAGLRMYVTAEAAQTSDGAS